MTAPVRELTLAGALAHARQLTGLVSARDILERTCRTLLDVLGGSVALAGYALPGAGWESRTHVAVPGGAVPAGAVSALFALHRRIAGARQPLFLERSPEVSTLFEGLRSAAQGAELDGVLALPLVHRTGKLVGEIAVAGSSAEAPEEERVAAASHLAALAAGALEGAQRLAYARADQERLHLLAEASEETLWDWKLDSDEFWWGGGVQKLMGWGGTPVQNRASWKLERVHPGDRERVARSFEQALASPATSSWTEEYRIQRPDGSSVIIEDRGYFLRDSSGRPHRVVGALRDVSTLKSLLSREQEARAEAEAASRAKDDFLAMLGHELRNPLAPILAAVDLLRQREIPGIERERTSIERQAQHLVRLVDDLLDVSRAASGKIEIHKQRVELAEVVAKSLEMARSSIDERGHRLEVEVPPAGLPLEADPDRLAQVICNLLTNAAKYTEPGGRITLRAERSGDEASLRVADTGIGIPEDVLPHVFDMFVQERQALDRSRGGLGLGLSIVRTLVRLHGGTVEAQSAGRGRGSEFTIRMPLANGAEEEEETVDQLPEPTSEAPQEGLRILVVDDNHDAADLFSLYLQHVGNRVAVAHDGPSAIETVSRFSPDVVLLDVGLPLMNGYEVARTLRAGPGGERLRLIAVTGYGQDSDRQRAKEAGFDAHLVKPVTMAQLHRAIKELTEPQAPAQD